MVASLLWPNSIARSCCGSAAAAAAACSALAGQPGAPPNSAPPLAAHTLLRDAPLILAAGGAKGSVSVWDTMSSAAVNSFVQRHAPEVAAAAGGEQQQQQGAA